MRTEDATFSRRSFLAVSVASIAASTISARDGAGADDPWRLGVQSYTFREFDTERALQQTRDVGLGHAEFFERHIPTRANAKQVDTFLALCKEYEVKPVAFGVSTFTRDHDANRKIFDFGRALGIKCLTASPTPDAFDSLDKLVEEYQIAIAIHPHGPIGGGRLDRWFSAEAIMSAVKDRHPLIGSCLDTGHLIRAAQLGKSLDPAEQVRVMGARNFGLHLKDHDNQTKSDVVLGKGSLRVKELVAALRDVNFQGFISIEYEAEPKNPAADVAECVRIWRTATGKAL